MGATQNPSHTPSQGSLLVTGAAGFIGSNFVDMVVGLGRRVVVLDALTYAGHTENLERSWDKITFAEGDINDAELCLLYTSPSPRD